MRFKFEKMLLIAFACSGLLACGGGGSTATTGITASVLAFPLKSGANNLIVSGYSKAFTVSGTCTGSANISRSGATSGATFEGSSALSAVETITASYTGCSVSSAASSVTGYYDSNYVGLGYSSSTRYGVFRSPPVIPTTVTVGMTAIIGSENLYTNSSKATSAGRSDISFVIEPDSSTTAIVNVIGKDYDTSNALLSTVQSRFRIDASGLLTSVSVDVQYSTTSTTHLFYQ